MIEEDCQSENGTDSVVQFVLGEGQTEVTVSAGLGRAYELCQGAGLEVVWRRHGRGAGCARRRDG